MLLKCLKEKLKKLILKYYGDLCISKVGWIGVSDEVIDVMRGWMVENIMYDFFNLLSYVVKIDLIVDNYW